MLFLDVLDVTPELLALLLLLLPPDPPPVGTAKCIVAALRTDSFSGSRGSDLMGEEWTEIGGLLLDSERISIMVGGSEEMLWYTGSA